jgi:hypothetical protein
MGVRRAGAEIEILRGAVRTGVVVVVVVVV